MIPSSLKSVKEIRQIRGLNSSVFSSPFLAVRMNKLNHLSALKPEKDKWNQICDYLLIGQANG